MTTIQYFDFEELFVNQIAGGSIPFIFLSLIVILIIASKKGFHNDITLTILFTFALIMSAFFQSILAITLLVLGLFIAFSLNRLLTPN